MFLHDCWKWLSITFWNQASTVQLPNLLLPRRALPSAASPKQESPPLSLRHRCTCFFFVFFLWPPLYINKPHFFVIKHSFCIIWHWKWHCGSSNSTVCIRFLRKYTLLISFFFALRYIYPIYIFSLRIMWFRFDPGGAVVDDVPRIPLWVGSRRSDSLLKIQMEVLLKTGVWKKKRQNARQMDKESKICPLLCLNGFC